MPRAAIFDVDGTLVDSVDQRARVAGRVPPLWPKLRRFGEEMQQARRRIYRERHMSQVRSFPHVREDDAVAVGRGDALDGVPAKELTFSRACLQ